MSLIPHTYPSFRITRIEPPADAPRKHDMDCKITESLPPVQLADRYVQAALEHDLQTPILDNFSHLSAPVNYFYNRNVNGLGPLNPFERVSQASIPPEVLAELDGGVDGANLQLGVFPELNRAWLVNGNKLVLWDFVGDEGYSIIDEIPNDILAVKLVRPKPSTFVESVQHLLIVSTLHSIYLLAISRKEDNIEVLDTGLSVLASALGADRFVWHEKSGRIFFTGKDDELNIWELMYSNEDRWFERRCSKRCLTRLSLLGLLPVLLSSSSGEHVRQLVLDDSREILYTLSSKSVIRAYALKKDGLEAPLVLQPSRILTDLRTTDCKGSKLLSGVWFTILAISVVPKAENENLYLVAITKAGCRIYLSGAVYGGRVAAFRLQNVKFPPSMLTVEEMRDEITKKNSAGLFFALDSTKPTSLLGYQKQLLVLANATSKSTVFSPGIFVAAVQNSKQDKENNKLFVSVPDYGVLHYYHEYVENATFLENHGIVYDIVQLTPSPAASSSPKGYANVFATQYTATPLHFAVLTNKGVSVFRQRTPTEIFASLGDQPGPFVERYGLQEACLTALGIVCSDRYAESIREQMFGFFASTEGAGLSARFYGLLLLIARIFREVWFKEVFVVDKRSLLPSGAKNMKFLNESKQYLSGMSIDKTQAVGFLNTVVVLLKFFEEYGPRVPYFQAAHSRDDEAGESEHRALSLIYDLLKIMKEAFLFLLILSDESLIIGSDKEFAFSDTVKCIPLETQKKLSKLRFCSLFLLDAKTKDAVKEVFTLLINKNISSGVLVDFLTDSLQKHCLLFCLAADVIVFRGFEHLRKAAQVDADAKSQELGFAVALLTKVGPLMQVESLREAVRAMVALDYYPGVIEFVLGAAGPAGPERESARIERFRLIFEALVEIDVKAIALYEKNKRAFGNDPIILESTRLRDQSYALCFQYDDRLFQYEFYDWFVQQGLEKKLLEIDTPYILPYLQERSAGSPDASYLLLRFYSKRGLYFEAAEVFFRLAISDFSLSLDRRIEYLAKASGFCNCVEQFALRRQTAELLHSVQSNLDVAGLQLELVERIRADESLINEQRDENVAALDGRILDISLLYNEFAEPLGYDDLCLVIFKESDYRGAEEIEKKWDAVLEAVKRESEASGGLLPVMAANAVVAIGKRVSSSEVVFPIAVLVEKLKSLFGDNVSPGSVVEVFLKSGVSYSKLYYTLRQIVETGLEHTGINGEMVYLIRAWWSADPRLKEVISTEVVEGLKTYSVESDPIDKYIKELE